MEAQAAAQKLAAQHLAQAAIRGQHQAPAPQAPMDISIKEEHDEPTDLTMDAEEKLRMRRERFERERSSGASSAVVHQDEVGRDRDPIDPLRHPQFDFRHLIPQVSIKSE